MQHFLIKYRPECVDLGALGSHHLEHFFGGIRRISNGNDTAEHFEYCVYDALLKNVIKKNLFLKDTEARRISSSGVHLWISPKYIGGNCHNPPKVGGFWGISKIE